VESGVELYSLQGFLNIGKTESESVMFNGLQKKQSIRNGNLGI